MRNILVLSLAMVVFSIGCSQAPSPPNAGTTTIGKPKPGECIADVECKLNQQCREFICVSVDSGSSDQPASKEEPSTPSVPKKESPKVPEPKTPNTEPSGRCNGNLIVSKSALWKKEVRSSMSLILSSTCVAHGCELKVFAKVLSSSSRTQHHHAQVYQMLSRPLRRGMVCLLSFIAKKASNDSSEHFVVSLEDRADGYKTGFFESIFTSNSRQIYQFQLKDDIAGPKLTFMLGGDMKGVEKRMTISSIEFCCE